VVVVVVVEVREYGVQVDEGLVVVVADLGDINKAACASSVSKLVPLASIGVPIPMVGAPIPMMKEEEEVRKPVSRRRWPRMLMIKETRK